MRLAIITTLIRNRIKVSVWAAAIALLVFSFVPGTARAGTLTTRSLTLSSSSAAASNATTTYTFEFSTTVNTALNGITVELCTTASGSCTGPTGLSDASASFTSLNYDADGTPSSQSGWTSDTAATTPVDCTTANVFCVKNNASATSVTNSVELVISNMQNPTTTNQTFYARITTYSGDDFTTSVDSGTMATSTANVVTVNASVDESLTFCVYTGANCAAGGSTVNMGAASSTDAATGTNKMDAATNGTGGYSITYNGATLTSGGDTIPAQGATKAAFSNGTSKFGINLKANTSPEAVGTEPTNTNGNPATNYNTANEYAFAAGATTELALATGPAESTTFTVSYVATVSSGQAAGSYTTDVTYVCTATF